MSFRCRGPFPVEVVHAQMTFSDPQNALFCPASTLLVLDAFRGVHPLVIALLICCWCPHFSMQYANTTLVWTTLCLSHSSLQTANKAHPRLIFSMSLEGDPKKQTTIRRWACDILGRFLDVVSSCLPPCLHLVALK